MNRAAELLDVIEASHLSLVDDFSGRRSTILSRLEGIFKNPVETDESKVASLASVLLEQGMVMGEQSDVEEVVAEYFHVVSDEGAGLGDDEMQFLNNFLK